MKKSTQKPLQKIVSNLHPSWAFYACVVGIISGVVILETQLIQPPFSGLACLALACALLIIAILRASYISIILAFTAGIIFASCRVAPEVVDTQFIKAQVGQTITLTGKVSAEPAIKDSGVTMALTDLKISPSENLDSRETKPLSATLYIQLSKTATSETLLRSDKITITGKLSQGFGAYPAAIYRPEILNIDRADPGDLAAKFKNFFADKVREHIPSPAADLGLGYLVGDKTGLSEDFSEALRAVGMTHVVVASGAHLGILIGLIKKLFGKISKFAGLLFSLLAIFAFALVVGFTASMTRAALVAGLSLLFGYVGRTFTPFHLILLVAALTLLISPTNLLGLGWQLSFASFFGILILAPRLTKFLYGGKKPPWLASMLITSLATSLICTPLLIFNFGTFSLLSFVANLVILPTLPCAMLLVFLSGATSFLSFLATPIATLATILLNFHINFINFLSTKTALIFELSPADPRIFLLYLPIIFCLIFAPLRKHFHRRPCQLNKTLSPCQRLNRQSHKLRQRPADSSPELIAETVEICYNNTHDPPR